jgi:hypothetical protein
VLVSTEGVHSDVLEVRLPAALTAPTDAPDAAPAVPALETTAERSRPRSARDWAGIALTAAAVAGLGYLAVRGSRVRGPGGR